MTSTQVIAFDDDAATIHDLVGGKGANLGVLSRAGFPVPTGFTVTTAVFAESMAVGGLDARIAEQAGLLDHSDPDELERVTGEIRALIAAHLLPDAIEAEVRAAYAALGDDVSVAVRSSGTAEDLAEASFAGMHDTYLDVRGTDGVIDAIKRCWASLWTARAASYRATKGFDHSHGIAVVVQTMVPSEVSGVMFTANPLTAATDEIVINASWGLGEAIVSGITTPDEFAVHAGSLRIKERTLGTKERQVVRDPATGVGTIAQDTPGEDRDRLSLTDEQVQQLALLGRRVQEHYDGFPQDTEWGYVGGQFFLLQARPVTGAEFAWDADVDAWQWLEEAPDDAVWTRAWSDDIWCGAISPLFYSYRAACNTRSYMSTHVSCGNHDLARMRNWKYFKGNAYYRCELDAEHNGRTALPSMRPGTLTYVPPAHHQEVYERPLSILSYIKLQLKLLSEPHSSVIGWIDHMNHFIDTRKEEAAGLPDEQLRVLSDTELKRELDRIMDLEREFIEGQYLGFFVHARDAFGLLAKIVTEWYDGGRATVFNDLITGCPRPTMTIIENGALWQLTKTIRESDLLSRLFEEHEDAAFWEACGDSEEGRAWLAQYDEFIVEHGHRGHADRDMYYTRRAEDPAVDYRSIKAFLASDADADPAVMDHETQQRRIVFINEVADDIAQKSFGGLRANLFRMTLDYVDKFLMYRDDERHWVDRPTYSAKRCFLEINRRLKERGILDNDFDFYMLTREELYDVFGGLEVTPLTRAKIAGRGKNFDLVLKRDSTNPVYLVGRRNADAEYLALPGEDDGGALRGMGTSAGSVTGTARVVKALEQIGRVEKDEILITNSTDPGWTPVFSVISAIVLETGGLLAHGSCLAREYGMPAVHLPGALRLIPDGAQIRIDGDAGTVELLGEPVAAEVAEPVTV